MSRPRGVMGRLPSAFPSRPGAWMSSRSTRSLFASSLERPTSTLMMLIRPSAVVFVPACYGESDWRRQISVTLADYTTSLMPWPADLGPAQIHLPPGLYNGRGLCQGLLSSVEICILYTKFRSFAQMSRLGHGRSWRCPGFWPRVLLTLSLPLDGHLVS